MINTIIEKYLNVTDTKMKIYLQKKGTAKSIAETKRPTFHRKEASRDMTKKQR